MHDLRTLNIHAHTTECVLRHQVFIYLSGPSLLSPELLFTGSMLNREEVVETVDRVDPV